MDRRLFLRQVGVLVSGTAVAQLVYLAGYPLLTRLYSDEEFGAFAIFMSVVAIVGAVSAGRFDLIVQSVKDQERFAVYALSQVVNGVVALLSMIGLVAYALLGGEALGPDRALLLGLAIFLTGFCSASSLFLVRQERYRLSSQAVVARALFTVVPQILLFYVYPSAQGLILGFCIGFGAQALLLVWGISKADRWRRPRPRQLVAVFRRHYRQRLIDVPGTILGAIVLNALNFFILALYTAGLVGQYSLAFRVAVMPLALFSSSLSEVFYQKATASYRRTGTFWTELRFNLVASSAMAIAIFVPLTLLAKPVFAILFGAAWLPAAQMLIYLAPMLAIRFVCLSIQNTPLVIGRVQWLLWNNVALLIAMGLAYLAAEILSLSIWQYLLFNTVGMSIAYLGFILYIVAKVRRSYR